MKVSLGAGIGVVVLILVMVAVLWNPVGGGQEEQQTEGMTVRQFRAVRLGASEGEIEARFGKAADRQDLELELAARDEPQSSTCLYYPEKGKELDEGRSFQFCFIDGRLDTKDIH